MFGIGHVKVKVPARESNSSSEQAGLWLCNQGKEVRAGARDRDLRRIIEGRSENWALGTPAVRSQEEDDC